MSSIWKTVRVFISSTFRDMHAERNHLVKVVFPALREELEKYRVHLDEIDMRWGVTREQADNDEALDVCLDQIDACRFFIGILGERYGYVSSRLPDHITSKYNSIGHHKGESITELEIRYGVLTDPERHHSAFFSFRDPAFIDDIPPLKRIDMQAEDAASAEKLVRLKQAIRDKRLTVVSYSCKYGGLNKNGDVQLTGLNEFGQQIADWLGPAIKAELELQEQPTVTAETESLAEEADYHERFMESRLRVYVGREQINDVLTAFVERDEHMPCLVLGPSGSGKSAALARFVKDYREKHPQTLVLPHFIGASPASASPRQMLRRFCLSLKSVFGFADDIPQDFNALATLFRCFLNQIPADRRTVFVLDALNQLDVTDNARWLNWLPSELPGHVKMIASCIDGRDNPANGGRKSPDAIDKSEQILHAFAHRTYLPVSVQALEDNEQRQIIRAVPSLSAKSLDDVQVDLLLSNPATSNPLFLLVTLEELRGFGSFEQLDRRIVEFPHSVEQEPRWHNWLIRAKQAAASVPDELKRRDHLKRLEKIESALNAVTPVADTLTDVFLQVIDRLERDFDPQVSRTVFSLLASAKEGLSERELQELLARLLPNHDGKRRDEEMQIVLRQVRSYLVRKGSLLDFYHDSFHQAAVARYLSDQQARWQVHRELAEFFDAQSFSIGGKDVTASELVVPNVRKLVELPWQLLHTARWDTQGLTADWERVGRLLSSLEFVEWKCRAGLLGELHEDYALVLQAWPGARVADPWHHRIEPATPDWQKECVVAIRSRAPDPWPDHGAGPLLTHLCALQSAERVIDIAGEAGQPVCALGERLGEEYFGLGKEAVAILEEIWLAALRERKERPLEIDGISLEHVDEFARFVRRHSQALASFPQETVALARNQAGTGPVAAEGEARAEELSRPWVARDPRPIEATARSLSLSTLHGHLVPPNAVVLSSDGRTALSVGYANTILVWDLTTGTMSHVLSGHTNEVGAVALSEDGRRAVSGGVDGNLRVWDVPSGACLHTFTNHTRPIAGVTMTPDGQLAASAGQDETVRVWDLVSWKCLTVLEGHIKGVRRVSITADGKLLASSALDESLIVWDVRSGKRLLTLRGRAAVTKRIALRSGGRLLFTIGAHQEDGELRVWDLRTQRCLRRFNGVTNESGALAVTRDGRLLLVGKGNEIEVWDVAAGSCVRTLTGHTSTVTGLALSLNGRLAVSVGWDRSFRIWDLCGDAPGQTKQRHCSFRSLAWTPDGKTAFTTGTGWHNVCIIDVPTNQVLQLTGSNEAGVVLAADGKTALSATNTYDLYLWDLARRVTVRKLKIDFREFRAAIPMALSPDCRTVVAVDSDKWLQVFDLASARRRNRWQTGNDRVHAIAFTPDGQAVAVAAGTSLSLWAPLTGKCLRVNEEHTREVTDVAISPDGRRLVSASRDGTLRVWASATGECLSTLETGYPQERLCLTPDGTVVVSMCRNRTLHVWSLESGTCVAIYHPGTEGTLTPAVRPDGQFLFGTALGELHRLRLRNVHLGIPWVTAGRRYRIHSESSDVANAVWKLFPWLARWMFPWGIEEEGATVVCPWCGYLSHAPDAVLNTIAAMATTANLQYPCLECPEPAWNVPTLFTKCSSCHAPLRFNPFLFSKTIP